MTTLKNKPVICFFPGSAGDWGGASRVLFTNLRQLDRTRVDPLVLLPREGPIVPELQRLGLRHEIWGALTEPGSMFEYGKRLIRAVRFFQREQVSLVHFNNRPWRPAEALAARLLGIPVLLHYHVVNQQPSPADRLARAAVVVSEFVRQASRPPELEKIVIYNPVELDRFSSGHSQRADLGIAGDKVVITFLGQIRDIKGVQDFITMARLIEDPNLVFLIAGECRDPKRFPGSYTEADLLGMCGGDARIRYIGYVSGVEDVYQTADIVVVPSRWEEPLGLIAIEAAACGRPVVATRVGGIPEIIDDGRTGYLVAPQDVHALAARVEQLVSDPLLRRRLGETAREHIRENFTTLPVRQFEELLTQLARTP